MSRNMEDYYGWSEEAEMQEIANDEMEAREEKMNLRITKLEALIEKLSIAHPEIRAEIEEFKNEHKL